MSGCALGEGGTGGLGAGSGFGLVPVTTGAGSGAGASAGPRTSLINNSANATTPRIATRP
jgi:hypothetical protein